MLQNNIQVIQSVMDEMASFEHETLQGKTETLGLIIDILSSYIKPQKKGDTDEPNNNVLGAYLCVSNVRNACKLRLLDVFNEVNAIEVINNNTIQALSLLQSISK